MLLMRLLIILLSIILTCFTVYIYQVVWVLITPTMEYNVMLIWGEVVVDTPTIPYQVHPSLATQVPALYSISQRVAQAD